MGDDSRLAIASSFLIKGAGVLLNSFVATRLLLLDDATALFNELFCFGSPSRRLAALSSFFGGANSRSPAPDLNFRPR